MGASQIKSDEQVVFFATAGSLDHERQIWRLPIHGWIYEPEQDDLLRGQFVNGLRKVLDVEDTDRPLFEKRVRWFLADSERAKTVHIKCRERVFECGRSDSKGYFQGEMTFPAKELAEGDVVSFEAVMPAEDNRHFQGQVTLLGAEGLTVISDVDDTIKVTEVADFRLVLKNTFLRPFRAVPGMADCYRTWHQSGVDIQFVSNSPWQLYVPLSEWMETDEFVFSNISLRRFRRRELAMKRLFEDQKQSKANRITQVIERFS